MKNKSELKIGILLNYLVTAFGVITTLVLSPIIIRKLGQSEYGLFETIGSFVNYLAILDLGFSSVVVRYVAKYQAEGNITKRNEFLYIARRIYTVLAFLILAIGVILYFLIDPIFGNSFSYEELQKAHTMFVIVLMTTATSIYSQVYAGALSGVEKFIIPRVIKLVNVVFTKVVAILIIYLGGGSIGYVTVLLAFQVITFLIYRLYSNKLVKFERCIIRFSEIKELLVFTGFLTLQVIASQIYWQVDKLVIGSLLGTVVVAVYSTALNLQNIISNVSCSVKDILLPKATKIAIIENSSTNTQKFMVDSGRLVFIIYGIALAGLTLYGKEFIFLWLGEEYVAAYYVFLILGYSNILAAILSTGETVCKAYNKYGFIAIASTASAVFNFALTFVFVKAWDMIGAAVATAIGLLLGSIIAPSLYYRSKFNIKLMSYWISIFKGTFESLILSAIAGYFLNLILNEVSWLMLIVKSIITAGVFCVCMMLFGFASNEKRQIMSIIRIKKRTLQFVESINGEDETHV